MNKKLALIPLCAGLLFSSYQAVADINMGIFPRRPVAATHKAFKPLAEKLSIELGEKVNLIVPKNFAAFWDGVSQNKFDLVHYNQFHYIKSHKEHNYRVIACNEEFGSTRIAGALAVRNDSGINSIEDLKGKTILFGGGKKAMGSYIAPTSILKKAGLVEGTDYQVKFAKNPPSAVIGVFNKAADASGTGNVILKIQGVKKKIDTSQMKIIAQSDEFIHLPWAVKGDMPEEKVEKIQTFMISLKDSPEGQKILKSAKVNAFQPVTDKDYMKVREISNYVLGTDY